MISQSAFNKPGIPRILDRVSWWIWALLLITIPVTSTPLIANFTEGTPVSPLASLPLFILTIIWLLPYLLRGGRLPKLAAPLLAFTAVALLTSLRAHFLEIYPFKGITLVDRELRGLITLGVGVCFYLVASLIPQTESKLKSSLRFLYLGAFFLLIWSTVQALRLPFADNPPPEELLRIHRLFSIRDLFRNQVTGMAYEPSWLADQLVVLYLPLWFGSVLKRFSVFKSRWKWVTGELILLIWGLVILFLTYSRIGLVAIMVATGVLGISLTWSKLDRIALRKSEGSRWSYRQLKTMYLVTAFTIFILAVAGVVFLAVLTNERIRDLFSVNIGSIIESQRLPWAYNLANHLEYAERLMYWINAFLVFSQYPFLGVGLGNAGFFFRQNVPAFGTYLPEVLYILGPDRVTFSNPKSLWLRLLAETGFIGFALMVIFFLLLGLGALNLVKRSGLYAALGLAGGMALVAQIFEGLSLDTFALPQLWIMLGLITAGLMFFPGDTREDGRT